MANLNAAPQAFQLENNTAKRVVKDYAPDKVDIEIGDIHSPDFKPQYKFKRWDNDVNFSIRAEEHPAAQVEVIGDVIKYKTPDYEVHMYEKNDVSEDGGFEFEWVFDKKPKTNVLTTTIQTKELNFFYQPELTQEEIDEGSERPENVVGSYAVYHKTKRNNKVGGKEYKCGKAFHIYRPKAIDDNGTEVWCELNIDEQAGTLAVTVPQDFLDNATYPVVVDPTFGYTSTGASDGTFIREFGGGPTYESRRIGNGYNAPEDGTLDSITGIFRIAAGTASPDLVAFLFDEDSAATDSHGQIAQVERTGVSLTTSYVAQTFTFSSESLNSGEGYVLTVAGSPVYLESDTDSTYIAFDSTGSQRYYVETYQNASASTAYSNAKAENPWTAVDSATIQASIYATYTVATAGTADGNPLLVML